MDFENARLSDLGANHNDKIEDGKELDLSIDPNAEELNERTYLTGNN